MNTKVFRTIREWTEWRDRELQGKTLGFVPTMGALHAGHVSLMERSLKENDFTLVSIFVNPTQFNDPKDLEKYPRTYQADYGILSRTGVDFLLYPEVGPEFGELYPDHYRYRVQENDQSKILCGAHRPGHFDGVLTVVMKLLNIARAERAYFGEKDYQQLMLIQGMAEAFFMKTEIVGCPILREDDGLAMSSRNTLLKAAERRRAPKFAEILSMSNSVETAKMMLKDAGFEVDYVEDLYGRRFGAVRLGNVRLIDNVEI